MAAPSIVDIAPAVRAFQRRALTFLVAEAGVRQFLDIGFGLPLVGATHDVAQSLAPESRIAYVDNDPMVLSHARALLKSAPGGAVGYVDADVRDPGAIIAGAQQILDFSRPVAVLLLFTLAYVQDTAQAAMVVSLLMSSVPPGSYFAMYHLTERPGPGARGGGAAVEQDDAAAAHHPPLTRGGGQPDDRPRDGSAGRWCRSPNGAPLRTTRTWSTPSPSTPRSPASADWASGQPAGFGSFRSLRTSSASS